MYICIQHSGSTYREQKWALDPPKLGRSQLLCGCWELNVNPLQEWSSIKLQSHLSGPFGNGFHYAVALGGLALTI